MRFAVVLNCDLCDEMIDYDLKQKNLVLARD